jgi:hypothetical protein
MITYVSYKGVRLLHRDRKDPDHLRKVVYYKRITLARVLLQMNDSLSSQSWRGFHSRLSQKDRFVFLLQPRLIFMPEALKLENGKYSRAVVRLHRSPDSLARNIPPF